MTDLEQDDELTALARRYLGARASVLVTRLDDQHLLLVLRCGQDAVAAPMPPDSNRAYLTFALGRLSYDIQKVMGELPPLWRAK